MTHPKHLTIQDFTYHLPEDRIARYPLPTRDESKLLVYRNGEITEHRYRTLDEHIPAGSLLVFNNTKVVEARLLFQKATGGVIELFCLEPAEATDITTAMTTTGEVRWKCLVGGAKKWKEEPLVKTIGNNGQPFQLTVHKEEKINDYFIVRFQWDAASLNFADVLHAAGVMPLPPYLNRKAEAADQERYQTIYARHDGSVAAPTAGLHFTPALLEKLAAKQVSTAFVTLHVSAGTFKPVKADTMDAHDMHSEFIEVNAAFIETIIKQLPAPVITVGTTSLRTLESLYWMGVKVKAARDKQLSFTNISVQHLEVHQWDAYELPRDIDAATALNELLLWMQAHDLPVLTARTQIMIAPGYQLRIAQALITNFHQPQSTLLLLVAAIIGMDWRKVYDYAMTHDFRFLSYGDGSLLWNSNK
ncbi:S-adenosylmethionine:tRNA ribosyltransferase-isomerase [Filimonas effusa]|uniref:S-adenosylmethionine:tRNA ribosyltransferase-isomerase n=1 Tax=Filimonas effusa TaxID=2508721 RepID=A0A4Q1D0E5_9BACT|nr:S-adenosylmethionine:tRNA ribosyltransferase-isomerase [Filimonas effusa]RXK81216.1 S-adenosylmethionine:tRNA ribosyltransferase-isomerase [Filimonas effusa]